MRLFTRLIVCTAAAMILSAVLFHLADAWFGEDASVVGAGRILLHEARRTEALEGRSETVTRSLFAKRDIISELLEGRITYRQAIVQFQKANELVENLDLDLIPAYRVPTDPKGVARQVFTWTSNAVRSWPTDKAEHLLSGLAHEYETLFDGAKLEEGLAVRPMNTNATDRTEASSAGW